MILDLSRPSDLNVLADLLADRIKERMESPAAKHITFKEAMSELDIKYDALKRRLDAHHIPTYWVNGGKAFDRKHLNKLR